MRDRHERFSEAQQRAALDALAASPQFLHTQDGLRFLWQIEQEFVPRQLQTARQLGLNGAWVHAQDIVHTAIIGLCDQGGRVARYAAAAKTEPWAYLAQCLSAWMREQWGSRGATLDDTLVSDQDRVDDTHLTPITAVVARTHELLAPYTAPQLVKPLRELLHWLATNPPQRISYESVERGAAEQQFPQFAARQIAAVINIAWGGRPRRRQTSVMAAVLQNQQFRISDSPTHARALLRYSKAMRTAELGALVTAQTYFLD